MDGIGRCRAPQMPWREGREGGQEGQAMVETALMITAVLLLLMGIIEFGFLFYAHVRVANAAREGARAGSLLMMRGETDWCTVVRNAVQAEVSGIPGTHTVDIQLDAGPVSECGAWPATNAGEPITVTVTHDFDLPVVSALPIIRDIISSPYPVSRTVVMRFQ